LAELLDQGSVEQFLPGQVSWAAWVGDLLQSQRFQVVVFHLSSWVCK
jgi:hypothetical protein